MTSALRGEGESQSREGKLRGFGTDKGEGRGSKIPKSKQTSYVQGPLDLMGRRFLLMGIPCKTSRSAILALNRSLHFPVLGRLTLQLTSIGE